jgi:D-lactate dehydrogenase (cytochrome)
LEFHGTESGVAEQSQRFGEIAADLGGGPFEWTAKAEDRTRLWQARHDGYWAAKSLRPGSQPLASDVCVPISRLAECVTETQADLVAARLLGPIVGHVGDGNFHVALLVDTSDAREMAATEDFLSRLAKRALRMGGTCTGEHGVGQGKMKYLLAEHGAPALAAMRAIKKALDPDNIMNPGKLVPAE